MSYLFLYKVYQSADLKSENANNKLTAWAACAENKIALS